MRDREGYMPNVSVMYLLYVNTVVNVYRRGREPEMQIMSVFSRCGPTGSHAG